MSGYVYFIQSGGRMGPIKIGWTKNDPITRLRDLQTGNPEPLELLSWRAGGPDLEAALHLVMRPLHLRGEWFAPGPLLLAHAGFPPGGTDQWVALDDDLRPIDPVDRDAQDMLDRLAFWNG